MKKDVLLHKTMNLFFQRLVIFSMALLMPLTSHAGIISFVSGLFNEEVQAETTDVVVMNSQNMSLLHAAINIDPNPSRGGAEVAIVDETALLSEVGPSGSIANIDEGSATHGQISTYVVRQGDSLSKIAEMFDVSVNTIIWANNLKGGVIHEGQTLVILPISGVRHTIKSGETLQAIANKYKADLGEVLDYNNISESAVLAVGDVLTIPNAELPAPAPIKKTIASTPKLTAPLKGANGPSFPGYFQRPVKGGVRTQGLHGYNGVDIAAPVGTPIYAAAAGTVIVSSSGGWNLGYGNYIVISHPNGTQTLYAHASKLLVSLGERVEQGQNIALMGSTGKSTGSHVHFEIRGAKNPF